MRVLDCMNPINRPEAKTLVSTLLKVKNQAGWDDEKVLDAYLDAVQQFPDKVVFRALKDETATESRRVQPNDLIRACHIAEKSIGKRGPSFVEKHNGKTRDELLDWLACYRRYGVSNQYGQDMLLTMMDFYGITHPDIDAFERARGEEPPQDMSKWPNDCPRTREEVMAMVAQLMRRR